MLKLQNRICWHETFYLLNALMLPLQYNVDHSFLVLTSRTSANTCKKFQILTLISHYFLYSKIANLKMYGFTFLFIQLIRTVTHYRYILIKSMAVTVI